MLERSADRGDERKKHLECVESKNRDGNGNGCGNEVHIVNLADIMWSGFVGVPKVELIDEFRGVGKVVGGFESGVRVSLP